MYASSFIHAVRMRTTATMMRTPASRRRRVFKVLCGCTDDVVDAHGVVSKDRPEPIRRGVERRAKFRIDALLRRTEVDVLQAEGARLRVRVRDVGRGEHLRHALAGLQLPFPG